MDGIYTADNGQTYSLDASMSWMLAYERAFRADALSATLVLLGDQVDDQLKRFLTIGVIWSMIRNHAPEIEAADEWKRQVGEIDFKQAHALICELLETSYTKIEEAVEVSAKSERATRVTTMQLIAAGIDRGLTLADTKMLTLGMWLDYITAHNNLNTISSQQSQEEPVRWATQADIDKLKG